MYFKWLLCTLRDQFRNQRVLLLIQFEDIYAAICVTGLNEPKQTLKLERKT